jgi:predicted nucleic acid-binding protein
MSRVVLLDSGPLGMYANPAKNPRNEACRKRVNALLVGGLQVKVPGIAVYENRRELLHLQLRHPAAKRLQRFEVVIATLGVLPVTDDVMQRAAVIWAEARYRGHVTAPPESLDGGRYLGSSSCS